MKLSFLKQSKWPRIAKPMGEVKYGFSEDDELCEQAAGDLIAAFEAKDGKAFAEALTALIEILRSKENEPDSLEDASVS